MSNSHLRKVRDIFAFHSHKARWGFLGTLRRSTARQRRGTVRFTPLMWKKTRIYRCLFSCGFDFNILGKLASLADLSLFFPRIESSTSLLISPTNPHCHPGALSYLRDCNVNLNISLNSNLKRHSKVGSKQTGWSGAGFSTQYSSGSGKLR